MANPIVLPGATRRRGTALPGGVVPRLGLVCMTIGPEVRFRTITRTKFLSLPESERAANLGEVYRHNIRMLFAALDFCHARGIGLYRATSALFPHVDDSVGKHVLAAVAPEMAPFGRCAKRRGVRVVLHPDQYVVLNSESEAVRAQSLAIMEDHALVFDMLGLPRSPWSCMILHGGKGGRADFLADLIPRLPRSVRRRLVLENDERAYGAAEILAVCRRAGVPMVFDAHHHAVRERLSSYEHKCFGMFTRRAAKTWPDPSWQVVHVSNGRSSFGDPRHSELITEFPSAFRSVPWVEVEAKAKEVAIEQLLVQLASDRGGTPPAPAGGQCQTDRRARGV